MRLLKVAVRWGAWIALSDAVLDIVLYILGRFRWYRDTAWFQVLAAANYPPSSLAGTMLRALHVPRLYDVPSAWWETVLITVIEWFLMLAWWFLVGATCAVIWQKMKATKHGAGEAAGHR